MLGDQLVQLRLCMLRGSGKQQMLQEMGRLLFPAGKVRRANTDHQPHGDIAHFSTRLHHQFESVTQSNVLCVVEPW